MVVGKNVDVAVDQILRQIVILSRGLAGDLFGGAEVPADKVERVVRGPVFLERVEDGVFAGSADGQTRGGTSDYFAFVGPFTVRGVACAGKEVFAGRVGFGGIELVDTALGIAPVRNENGTGREDSRTPGRSAYAGVPDTFEIERGGFVEVGREETETARSAVLADVGIAEER